MRHLGDITKISGHEAPVVDVVIGGSPCQDLSIAGKRAGLAGERSGLYMEQIRIIKEMREADVLRGKSGVYVRPRYMVWENVPGAFSSNGGQDFAAVVEEAIRVADPEAPAVPVPEKGWPTSGVYADECGRWSVAWRVLDAQFWGVPQRRRRIALVADFGGLSAPEILFVRKSVSGNLEPCEQKRKEVAGAAGDGAAGASYAIQGSMIGRADQNGPQGDGVNVDVSFTLNTIDRHAVAYGIGSYHSNAWKSDNPYSGVYEADTAKTLDALNCGYPACNQGGMAVVQPTTFADVASTLRAGAGAPKHDSDIRGRLAISYKRTMRAGFEATPINLMVATRGKALGRGTGFGVGEPGDPANTISAAHSHGVFATAIPINDKATRWQGGGESRNHDGSGNGLGIGKEGDPSPTLTAGDRHGVMCGNQVPLTYGIGNGQAHEAMTMAQEVSQTLNTMHDKQAILYQPKSAMEENWAESKIKNAIRAGESKVSHAVMCEDVSHTLRAKANCAYREDTETYPVQNMMARRLTPLECERLQGYPDGWTDIGEWIDSKGKKHQTSDTSRYKALGNSIALPFWYWMMQNMAEYLPEKPTLGSLFDGIGGFPLCWERIHGKGTARWASEIEEFPMAVTKKRFGEG